ncbi:MAG: metalloregulator ArsR/SmtB family transcription factor [Actinobacteria bacterium]|jgi:ArsR family transcriptional regulator|nr:winged helix-turn-helix transcriptional regulator [Actinomycetota bacterium]MCJ7473039.1 metalloregulator ArsR/SmtB family transcription factor [Actinomycetota bacterium]
MPDQNIKNIEKIIKALADKNRLRMVYLLNEKQDLCVCEITDIIGLSQPTISSHLRLLENADLVESDKDGLWVNYNINSRSGLFSRKLVEMICKDLRKDKQIISDLKKLKAIDRDKICGRGNK